MLHYFHYILPFHNSPYIRNTSSYNGRRVLKGLITYKQQLMPYKPHQTECTVTLHLTHTSLQLLQPVTWSPGQSSTQHWKDHSLILSYTETCLMRVNDVFRAESCGGIVCCCFVEVHNVLLLFGLGRLAVTDRWLHYTSISFYLWILKTSLLPVTAVTKETLMSTHTVKLSNGSLIPYLKGLH